jgi:uncharacterized protein (TIRG00374 family)
MKQQWIRVWRWVGPFSGIAGLFLLLKLADAGAVAATLSGAEPVVLLLAAPTVLITTALRARRWVFLFRQRQVHIPFRRLLDTNLIGSFYGQFLPLSSVVGATLLFAESARCGCRAVDFFTTVLVERVLNLISLFAAASFILLVARPADLPAVSAWTIHLAFIGSAAGLIWLRRGWGIGRAARLLARLRLGAASQHLGAFSQALQSDLGQWHVLGRGVALSLLVNASLMTMSYLVTLAVAGPTPFLSFMALVVLIITLQGIPITPGSLGMREGLYVFFLGLLGISRARALSVGLLILMLHWLQGFIGGLVLLQRSLAEMGVKRALGRISSLLFPRPKHPTPRSAVTPGTPISPEIPETLS